MSIPIYKDCNICISHSIITFTESRKMFVHQGPQQRNQTKVMLWPDDGTCKRQSYHFTINVVYMAYDNTTLIAYMLWRNILPPSSEIGCSLSVACPYSETVPSGSESEDGCLLGCSTVKSGRSLPTFQRTLLSTSSGR
jgi:hypothetical protein